MITSPWGTQTPPQGWQFYQPQFNWTMPSPVAQTITSATTLIIQIRKRNAALTAKHNLATDFQTVQDELITYNAKRLNMATQAISPSFRQPQPMSLKSVAVVAAAVRDVAAGAINLSKWGAAGAPIVEQEQSTKRARVCTAGAEEGKPCPFNNTSDAALARLTIPVSELIRTKLQGKREGGVKTPFDEQLGVCDVCHCPLKLKVHEPIDFVLQTTSDDKMAKFPEFCWIKRRE